MDNTKDMKNIPKKVQDQLDLDEKLYGNSFMLHKTDKQGNKTYTRINPTIVMKERLKWLK